MTKALRANLSDREESPGPVHGRRFTAGRPRGRDVSVARSRESAGPQPQSAGVRALEVVHTDTGVWLVVPYADHVKLWPSTPTAVRRLLTALLPRDHELANGEADGPLH
jgi:hypothetical protein